MLWLHPRSCKDLRWFRRKFGRCFQCGACPCWPRRLVGAIFFIASQEANRSPTRQSVDTGPGHPSDHDVWYRPGWRGSDCRITPQLPTGSSGGQRTRVRIRLKGITRRRGEVSKTTVNKMLNLVCRGELWNVKEGGVGKSGVQTATSSFQLKRV